MFAWVPLVLLLVVGTALQYVLLRRWQRGQRRTAARFARDRPDEGAPDAVLDNATEARFDVDPPEEGMVRCANCGHENEEVYTYCEMCLGRLRS